jgi:hypothetical protein
VLFLSFDSPKERNTRPNESFDSGGKKKRPRKPTSIFSFTQKSSQHGCLKKLQFALFVDASRTATYLIFASEVLFGTIYFGSMT